MAQHLQDQADILATIATAAQDAILMMNDQGQILFWNKAAERIFGWTLEEALEKNLHKLLAPQRYLDTHLAALPNFVATGQGGAIGKTLELQALRKNGEEFTVSLSLASVQVRGRWRAIGILRDITELKAYEKNLQETERKFRAIFNQSFEFVGLMTLDGTLIDANRAALQAAGIAESEVLGKLFWETPWWDHSPEQQEQLKQAIREVVEKGQTVRFEATHLTPAGRMIWVDFSLKPVFDDQGKTIYLIPEGRDITELKEEEDRLNQINQCLLNFGPRPEKNMNAVVATAGRLLGGAVAMYHRDMGEELQLQSGWNIPENFAPTRRKQECPCGEAILTGNETESALVIQDLCQTRYSDPHVVQMGLKSYVGYPVRASSKVVGVLCVIGQQERTFSQHELRCFLILAQAIGREEERLVSLESIRQSYQSQVVLNNILQLSLEPIPLEKLLDHFLAHLFEFSWFKLQPTGCIFLVEEETKTLVMKAQRNLSSSTKHACSQVGFGECLCGRAAESGEVVFTSNLDPRHKALHPDDAPHGHYCIPIKSGRQLIGVLCLYLEPGHQVQEKELGFLRAIGSVLAAVIERHRLGEKLRREHQKNIRLLASISSAMIGLDQEHRITQWNPAAERLFGIPAGEALGKPLSECAVPWDWKKIIAAIPTVLEEEHPVRLDRVPFKRLDGKEGQLGVTINAVKGGHEKSSEFLILGNDITERLRLETQLLQAQKLESIGQLAAGIAHEINTPTQFIGDNIHFLEDAFKHIGMVLQKYRDGESDLLDSTRAEAFLKEIQVLTEEADLDYLLGEVPTAIHQSLDGVERVAKIVRAMKEFSHPGSGEKKQSDLRRMIENTVTVARNEWKYVAEMELDLDPALIAVPCYPGELNQAFLNIIVNAAHAIGEKTQNGAKGKGLIRIVAKKEGDLAEVRIQDNGAGIPEVVRPRIFDPFFTTKEVGKGTGQGLTQAYSVVQDKHNGTLTFETEVGKGTTFIIRLPL